MKDDLKDYYLWKRGRIYYFKFKNPEDGIGWRSTKQSNVRLAHQFISQIIREGRQEMPTLNDYSKDFYVWDTCKWIKRQHAKGKSFSSKMAQARRGQLKNYILPQFGNRPIDKINPLEFEDWVIDLPLANGTKNAILYTLKIILTEAERGGVLKVNPLRNVEKLADKYKKRDIFTEEEIKLLFPHNREELFDIWGEPYYGVLFTLLLTTGMRLGEATALQWKHVLWDYPGIVIERAVKQDYSIGMPKNGEKRSVIIPETTKELLAWWKENTLSEGEDDLIFHGMDYKDLSKPISRHTIPKKFKQAMDKVEIKYTDRSLSPHSLRHNYNTKMRSI